MQEITSTGSFVFNEISNLSFPYSALISHSLEDGKTVLSLTDQLKLTANVLAYDDVFRLYFYIAMVVFIIFLIKIFYKSYSL
ncbi:MAG: Inner-membrane proton/drug antiporter (MSF type) of tripartite multidrug efflux system [Bartonella clarridgeiae]|nr:MAG: Inner-membrane proton/drug antiporter (MSF type) of tripartite multidrug efflux system [Bartonella clarridgeiae]